MQKVLIFSVALAAFSGVASAAPACGTTAYTLSALATLGGSCEAGDKVFSNFGGNMDSINPNLTVTFTGGGNGPYNVTISDVTNAALTETSFTFNYTVSVDLLLQPTNYISKMGAGGLDSLGGSTATNANTTNNAGCSTVTSSDVGSGFPVMTCNTTGQPTSLAVAQTYTGGAGASTVTNIQDSFLETTPVTSPEPVSMILFGSGLLAISLVGRRKLVRK